MAKITGIVFEENVDNATTLQNVAALADNKYKTNGDDFYVPKGYTKLIAYQAWGAVTTRAQITSPSLRVISPIEIEPIDLSTEPTSNMRVQSLLENPIELVENEKLNALTINTGGAAVKQVVALWLADEVPEPIKGAKIYTIRATASKTLVAYTWTQTQITLDVDLPEGTYEVVGARLECAGGILARFVFAADETRPMFPCYDAASDIEDPLFRMGRLGTWGEFDGDSPPQVEILSLSADTSETIWLDIIKKE